MSGTLFVVSTPIGNLEDITLRALRVLREANLIAAEDTRRTARLLAHYGVATRSISFHQHNTQSRLAQLMARLQRGESVALVTDAGTPAISDPGLELVQACVRKGIPVEPVPGPSAPLAAATASGFPLDPLTIFGFVPSRAKDRAAWLERARMVTHTFTFFDAPHRIRRTLAEIVTVLVNRPIVVAREITKVHQQFLRGPAGELAGQFTAGRGEFTVVVGPLQINDSKNVVLNDRNEASEIYAEFGRSTDSCGLTRRQVVTNLARKYGRSPKEVYGIIERLKNSGI